MTPACLSLAACLALGAPCAAAPARPLLDEMFQDHAVLQRDRPIPVWGEASPGEELTISLNGSSAHAVADAQGHWQAQLTAVPAGGPYRLTAPARGGTEASSSAPLW